MSTLRMVVGGVALLLLATTLRAGYIELPISDSFSSTEHTGCSALLTMSFEEAGGDDRMLLQTANTTPEAIGSRLTAVGLELPRQPSLTPEFAPGGKSTYFDALEYDVWVSPGWLNASGGYDLMITSDHRFEGGSPAGAPAAGEYQTVILSLGDTGLTLADLERAFSDFYSAQTEHFAIARFQAVGPLGEDSDKVARNPEPASLALLLLGFLGLRRFPRGRN